MDVSALPRYREAVSRETEIRELAFILDAPEIVCGVAVHPLSFENLLRLKLCHSPFVCAGVPSAVDIAQFLWCVSLEYSRAEQARKAIEPFSRRVAGLAFWLIRRRFLRSIRKLNFGRAVEAIQAYCDEAFQDSPGTTAGFSPQYYAGMAVIVDTIGTQYGWTMRQTAQLPIKVIFQLLRRIEKRSDSGVILFNPSDRIRREEIERMNKDQN